MIGLVADDNRPEMMFNKTGTYVAMTQILLRLWFYLCTV
ncbi:MAG: hypothetical protein CM15mP88_1340 [Pseudomonadota bacterium]|nr:MAG: hypothetical protein CM15mP88_1340 [Pseudomonadota bacterium]